MPQCSRMQVISAACFQSLVNAPVSSRCVHRARFRLVLVTLGVMFARERSGQTGPLAPRRGILHAVRRCSPTHFAPGLEQFTKRCGGAGSWKCHIHRCFPRPPRPQVSVIRCKRSGRTAHWPTARHSAAENSAPRRKHFPRGRPAAILAEAQLVAANQCFY